MHIPRIIHNIWIQGYDQLSEDIREKHLKIKKINPNWDFIIWDERMIKEVIKKHPKIYNVYKNIDNYSGVIGDMASKSDIARCVIMKEFGGIYYDLDFDCISPFDELFDDKEESSTIYITNSKIQLLDYIYPFRKPKYCACFMAFEKNHAVWDKVFKNILNSKNKYDIGHALDKTLQANEDTLKIVILEKVKGHYSCSSKNKICFTPVKSSWNIYRPLLKYLNCNYKQITLVIVIFLILWALRCNRIKKYIY